MDTSGKRKEHGTEFNIQPLLRRDHLNTCLGGNVGDEVDDSVGVSELVVVPGDELDEVWVEDDGCSGVKNGRVGVGDEVGGDDLVLGVGKNSLEWSLGGGLDDLLDVIEGSWLLETSSEVDDGDVWGWHTEGHSGELSVELWDDLSDGLGGSGGGWDDVLSSSTAVSPELSGWSVNGLLGSSDGVDGGHKSLDDSEVVVDNLGKWGKAVGGARGVGDDVVVGMVVLLVVDSDDEHRGVGGWGRDDDLKSENYKWFDELSGVTFLAPPFNCLKYSMFYLDLMLGLSVLGHEKVVSLMGDGSLEASVGGVVLEQVDHVVDGDERVIDSDDVDGVLLDGGAEDKTSDSSESVDSDTWLRHG